MPVNIWEHERSPCYGCDSELRDKRAEGNRCAVCSKRIAYLEVSYTQLPYEDRPLVAERVGRPKKRGRPKIKRPPSCRVSSLIPKALHKKMKRYCTKKHVTAREFVEQAIQEKIEK